MTNQSLRERFKLSDEKAWLVSGILKDTVDSGKVKLDDPGKVSKRYSRYVPYWA